MASVKFTIKTNHTKVIAVMGFVFNALSDKGTTELDFDFYTTFLSKNFMCEYDGKISIISVNENSIEFVVKDYSKMNVNDFSFDMERICKYPIEISHENIDDDMEIEPISFNYHSFSNRFIWGLDKI